MGAMQLVLCTGRAMGSKAAEMVLGQQASDPDVVGSRQGSQEELGGREEAEVHGCGLHPQEVEGWGIWNGLSKDSNDTSLPRTPGLQLCQPQETGHCA